MAIQKFHKFMKEAIFQEGVADGHFPPSHFPLYIWKLKL